MKERLGGGKCELGNAKMKVYVCMYVCMYVCVWVREGKVRLREGMPWVGKLDSKGEEDKC